MSCSTDQQGFAKARLVHTVAFQHVCRDMDPAVKNEIQALIDEVDNKGLMKTWREIEKILSSNGLVSSLQIPPDKVGVHPSNRDGFGLAVKDVHRLLNLVSEVGFDESQINAWCVEVSHHEQLAVTKFNESLVRQSNGTLPAFPHPARYASLSASHTNAMLRACLHGCPHVDGEKVLTCDGALDMSRIESQDSGLAKAVRDGLKWKCVSHLAMECSGLVKILQSAMNASQQIARQEHEFQIFKRIANEIETSSNVKWGDIKAKLLASKPLCASACPHMFAFLSKYGQGHGLIERVEERLKSTTEMSKNLGEGFWKAIAMDSPKGCLDQFVTWRFAVLSVAYGSEFQVLITDVRKSLGKDAREKIVEIEALLNELHVLAKDLAPENLEHVYDAHDQIVMIGFERLKQKVVQEVMAEFVDLIEEITAKRLSIKWDMWSKRPEGAHSSSGAADPESKTMRSFDKDGKLVNEECLVHEVGFHVGLLVQRKSDKVKGMIKDLKDGKVYLEMQDDEGNPKIVTATYRSFFSGEWKAIKEKRKLAVEDLTPYLLSSSEHWNTQVNKAKIIMELHDLHAKHASVIGNLTMDVRPTRGIFSKHAYSKNKLILVPLTDKIAEKEPMGGFWVEIGKEKKFYLQAHNLIKVNDDGLDPDTFIHPFWLLRTSHEPEEVNMEVVAKRHGDFHIPVMTNITEISPGDELVRYLAKRASPIEDLEVVEETETKRRRVRRKATPAEDGH